MSVLKDAIKQWYADGVSAPPQAEDLLDGTELMDYSDGDQRRWGTDVTVVYRLGDEFVAVDDVRPATEEQSWGDYGDPGIYSVTPRVVITESVVYDRVTTSTEKESA